MAVVGAVQHKCRSGAARPAMLSHHKASPLLDCEMRFKQNQTCRPVSSSLFPQKTSRVTSPPGAVFSLLVVLLWTSLVGTTFATTRADPAILAQDDLVWKGSSLHIDHRPAPVPPLLMSPVEVDLESSATTPTLRWKRAVTTDPKAPNSDFTIPQPLDTGLSNNFTTSCSNFLSNLRNDETFKKCRPFSLMLQTSSGFFDASKSYLRITQTLDATCGVNATQCRKVMDDFARELMSATACKADLANDNPLVIQTVNGLIAYPVAYTASCLRDNEGSYCFANAVTNSSATTDSLPYYLPVGQELPGGSRPTCNSCLQDAMAVFAQYGNNATQPISKTYSSAAQQISIYCGRTFVNVTAAPLKGAATTTRAQLAPQFTLVLMFILFIFS